MSLQRPEKPRACTGSITPIAVKVAYTLAIVWGVAWWCCAHPLPPAPEYDSAGMRTERIVYTIIWNRPHMILSLVLPVLAADLVFLALRRAKPTFQTDNFTNLPPVLVWILTPAKAIARSWTFWFLEPLLGGWFWLYAVCLATVIYFTEAFFFVPFYEIAHNTF